MNTSEPDAQDQFELTLRGLLVEQADVRTPERLTVAAATVLREATPDRSWLPPSTGRFQSMFSVTKFVVAGVIVALFGGFLLSGVLMQQPAEVAPAAVGSASPEATPSTPFKLPAVIPEGIESGTVDTPLGTARWVHLTGGRETRPSLSFWSNVIGWPTGIAIFAAPEGGESYAEGITQPSQLWTSRNGIDWELQPLPVPADAHDASLTLVGDVYWLIAKVWSGDRLWRSPDGVTWEEFDPTGLAPPGPAGFAWNLEYSSPATAGDLTLIHRSGEGAFPFRDLGLVGLDGYCGDHERMRKLAFGVYQMTSTDEPPCPVLRFEETDTGLHVSDDATGEYLGEIVGADLGHIDQMPSIFLEGPQQLLIISDNEVIPVEVPWPAEQDLGVALFGVEDGIYAYAHDWCCEGRDIMSVWHTRDGRAWNELDPPSFLDGAPHNGPMWFRTLSETLYVTIFDDSGDDGGSLESWVTSDGIDWTPAPVPGGLLDGTYPVRLESGWFANDAGRHGDPTEQGDELWMHVGDTWVSLAELGIERPREGCSVAKEAVGNTTLFEGIGGCRPKPTGLWILTLDPSG
jgi:hypothetical protein